MEPSQDLVHRIRKHSSHSREASRGPIKATEPALVNQRRFSEVVQRPLATSQINRRASSGCIARGRTIPSSLSSPEPENQSPKPLSSQSLDNAGLAMRRALMLQRQDATTVDPDSQIENTKVYDNFPHTPPRPPSQPRPKSAKGRPRSGSRPRSSSAMISHPMGEASSASVPPQSPVSFSKYRPLPSINSSRMSSTSTCSTDSSQSYDILKVTQHQSQTSENDLSNRVTNISLSRKRKPPAEPPESEPDRIHLAIKNLDGSRHERWFRLSDTIEDILAFAESVTKDSLPENCEICTNELPRRVFSDLYLTLEDIGLQSRTVLYIQEQ